MTSTADLKAVAEALRRQARLAQITARLRRLSSDLHECPHCREAANADDRVNEMLQDAASMVIDVLDAIEKVRASVGAPPMSSKPSLRVFGGDDAA